MTTATLARPVQITATSTPNFFDVLSSDGFTHYPLLITGPGRVVCGCPAGTHHLNCRHRRQALETLTYQAEPVETPVPAAAAPELTCPDCHELTLWCGCHAEEIQAELDAFAKAKRSARAKKAAETRAANRAKDAAMRCKVCGELTLWCECDLPPAPALAAPAVSLAVYADLLEPMGVYFCQCGAEIAAKGLCQGCRDHEDLFGFVPGPKAA